MGNILREHYEFLFQFHRASPLPLTPNPPSATCKAESLLHFPALLGAGTVLGGGGAGATKMTLRTGAPVEAVG